MKTSLVLGVVFTSSALFSATVTDRTWIRGTTDKNPLVYKTGEDMKFSFEVKELEGAPKTGEYRLEWKRTGDDGIVKKGNLPFDGKSFELVASTDKPGFVRVEVTLVDAAGKKAGKKAYFDGGAGAGLDSLSVDPEPADFDAFFNRQYSRLDKIPVKADLVERKDSNKDARIYAVSVLSAGLRPVTGYLAVPRGVEKGVTYPARVGFHGYSGDSFLHGMPDGTLVTNGTCISFVINAHGLKLPEFGATEADRKALYWEARSNGHTYAFDPKQNADPETAYFNGMFLRVKRALQYVKTVKGWNGRDLIAHGGSQGGMQAIWAAACGEGVTRAVSVVPWNADIRVNASRLVEKLNLSSWGWYIQWADGLGYYDVINHVKRIPVSCRLEIPKAGLGDYICPPLGIMKLWRSARCPKKIVWVQGAEHGDNLPSRKGLEYPFEDKGEIRALTPIVPDSRWSHSWWMKRHIEKKAAMKKSPPDVVFLGDSITHFWDSTGKNAWKNLFAGKNVSAISLGFSGDRTEHLIWRIVEGGELDGYKAKAIVIMIGTNNTGHMPIEKESPSDTVRGVKRIVSLVREKQPEAKIVLHAVFPRGETKDDPLRRRNDAVNREIVKLADGVDVIWCDMADSFLDETGKLPKSLYPDLLHPGAKGYEIWAANVKPYIEWALSSSAGKAPEGLYSSYMKKLESAKD